MHISKRIKLQVMSMVWQFTGQDVEPERDIGDLFGGRLLHLYKEFIPVALLR